MTEEVIRACLEAEGITVDTEVSFTVVDNEEIRAINKKHRNIDKATDVLSFPLIDWSEQQSLPTYLPLGDIVLSMEKAIEQATAYGHSAEREISFLTAHSMLHLLGYDHETADEEKIMIARQKEIMAKTGLKR